MPRITKSVSQFAPELLELFKIGYRKETHIKLKTQGQAYALRTRLNALRKAMEREGHSLLDIAHGVAIRKPTGPELVIAPVDSTYLDAIRATIEENAELVPGSGNDPEVERITGSDAFAFFMNETEQEEEEQKNE